MWPIEIMPSCGQAADISARQRVVAAACAVGGGGGCSGPAHMPNEIWRNNAA